MAEIKIATINLENGRPSHRTKVFAEVRGDTLVLRIGSTHVEIGPVDQRVLHELSMDICNFSEREMLALQVEREKLLSAQHTIQVLQNKLHAAEEKLAKIAEVLE